MPCDHIDRSLHQLALTNARLVADCHVKRCRAFQRFAASDSQDHREYEQFLLLCLEGEVIEDLEDFTRAELGIVQSHITL